MIPSELETAYVVVKHKLQTLRARVEPILENLASTRGGTYVGRVKELPSLYEKVVLGGYSMPLSHMEDLFACSLILPRTPVGHERDRLETELIERFVIHETRSTRSQKPTEFIYDDLHYILGLRDSPILLDKTLLEFRFELQVKSFLFHGWAKATHDSIYKSPQESWRANRVAAETRALIELAEAALAMGENMLSDSAGLTYKPIDDRVRIANLLAQWWPRDLPENRRRLAIFVQEHLAIAGLSVEQFSALLAADRALELTQRKSLSLHQVVLVLLVEAASDALIRNLPRKNRFIFVSQAMEDVSELCRNFPAELRVRFSDVA